MELLILGLFIVAFVILDIAAWRYGHDSRDTIDSDHRSWRVREHRPDEGGDGNIAALMPFTTIRNARRRWMKMLHG